jgi:hypothetical protein
MTLRWWMDALSSATDTWRLPTLIIAAGEWKTVCEGAE